MFEHSFIIKNHSIVPAQSFEKPEKQVYEVIRFTNGLPVFFDEHFDRFLSSCKLAGVACPISRKELALLLVDLAKANDVRFCNVKYMVNVSHDGADFLAGFIASSYPSDDMYRDGVAVGLLHEERSNPNAKVLNMGLRQRANALMEAGGFFEVALVDRNGNITEGSRSNLFFVDANGAVATAPLGDVLGGITRMMVMQELQHIGVPVAERSVSVEEISCIKAAFVTGTSPSVLPIAVFGGHQMSVSLPLVAQIADRYQQRMSLELLSFEKRYLLC